MQEIHEFRVDYEHAHLLFGKNEGKNIDKMVKVVRLTREDPRFERVGELNKMLADKKDDPFFYSWEVMFKYTPAELKDASLFYFRPVTWFEPAGEECGTVYDEQSACPICGANAKRIGALRLKASSIPHKDIASTIAGEHIVSDRFIKAFKKHKLKGASFRPVLFTKRTTKQYYEIVPESPELKVSEKTLVGVDPFDFSEGSEAREDYIEGADYLLKQEKEVYKCPKGHLIGLNLLSEPHVKKHRALHSFDLFRTREKVGVRRGLLRPEALDICSPAFRDMVMAEKLTGFKFEIAHVG